MAVQNQKSNQCGYKSLPRGVTMGAFFAFFDLSFCIAILIVGAMIRGSDYQIVYFIGAISTFMLETHSTE